MSLDSLDTHKINELTESVKDIRQTLLNQHSSMINLRQEFSAYKLNVEKEKSNMFRAAMIFLGMLLVGVFSFLATKFIPWGT